MNNTPTETTALPGFLRAWERFWFTPADPSVLGAMRILTGLITAYTIAVYGFALQPFEGEHGWYDLKLRMEVVRERPNPGEPLSHIYNYPTPPRTQEEADYAEQYQRMFHNPPLPPYPQTKAEAEYTFQYHEKNRVDLRFFGLPIPKNADEKHYLEVYTKNWGVPPPAYARDSAEAEAIDEYRAREGFEPRLLRSQGTPLWSLWFHLTDPTAMAVAHWGIVLVTVLFTFGFCTRVTSVLTWVGNLWYIQRNPACLFGVDTMSNILLLYLAIGPSGAALSLDRLMRRWWSKAKPGVVGAWYRFWKKPVPADLAPADFSPRPQPSVSANFAMRLLQIHICIIYLIAGLAKLLGPAWWNGNAIWGVMANYEFAPMQLEMYNDFLRFIARDQFRYDLVMNGGCLFTLAFEISYAFLIWKPPMRWLYLSSAILLHGAIGMFMGLTTFSLVMLVMNMAFLRPEEINWVMRLVTGSPSAPRKATVPAVPALSAELPPVSKAVASTSVKKK